MEIYIKILKFHISNLIKIKPLLYEEYKYLIYTKYIDKVLEESYILCVPCQVLTCEFTELTGAYIVCITKLKKELYRLLEKHKKHNTPLGKLIQSLNTNIYYIITKNSEYCTDCNSFLIRNRNEWFCQKCNIFRGRIYLSKDEELDDDIKQKKSNISKHFDANLNRIYGIIDDKGILPECGLIQLRKKLDELGFDITSTLLVCTNQSIKKI